MIEKPGIHRTAWWMLSIFLGIIIFFGCAGIYSTVNFEILEPATVNLPESVDHVTILNRTPLTINLFDKEDIEKLTPSQMFVLDTLINHSILRGLNVMIRDSDIEAYKTPLWLSSRRLDTFGLDIPLTKREVNDLCKEYGSSAIISLEYYELDIGMKTEDFVNGQPQILYHEASCSVKWSIYLPGSPRPFNEYTTHDTLFFSYYFEGVLQELPSSAEMVRAVSYESGMSYGKYLVPTWSLVSRQLYKGREKALKETAAFTDEGYWDKAYNTWDSLLINPDSTLAAKAAHNMAIYHELEDDLTSALTYIQLAQSLDSTDLTESYIEDLKVRILNKKQVASQVRKRRK